MSRFSRSRRTLLQGAGVFLAGSAIPFPRLHAAEERSGLHAAEADFAARLQAVAEKCEELGLSAEAEITRRWAVVPRPDQTFLFLPDEDVLPAEDEMSPAGQFWKRKFLELRAEFAAKLFALAADETSGMLWSDRFRMIWRTLREDPTHAEARRILAVDDAGEDGLPGVARVRVSVGTYEYPDVGWRPRSWSKCKSDRFEVATNGDVEAARELCRRLERYRLIWMQLFPERWLGKQEFAKALQPGRFLRFPPAVHRVVLFATRAEYDAYLTQYIPRASESIGVYSDHRKISYFFGERPEEATVVHELGHQLFQEIGTVAGEIGRAANFWVIEGIATYLESLRSDGSRQILGGFTTRRMQNARYRLRHAGQWMPIDEFAAMAYSKFSTQDDLSFIYSQAAGLAHFFQHGVPDAAREGFFQYLDDVYIDRDPPDDLFRRTNMTPEEIRAQYLAFLDVTDEMLAAVGEEEALAIEDLCLSQTGVTDRGMRDVARFANVRWLDLAGAKIGAEGTREVGKLTKLLTLDLQGVAVDEAALTAIGALPSLEELILSDTAIDDDSLALLSPLPKLATLYLNRTAVTEPAIERLLAALPSLMTLSVVGTSVTPDAAKRLEATRAGVSVRAE